VSNYILPPLEVSGSDPLKVTVPSGPLFTPFAWRLSSKKGFKSVLTTKST